MNKYILLFTIFMHIKCAKEQKITDIEGNAYKIVEIGSKLWFSENLKTTKFSNGDKLLNIINDSVWLNFRQPAYCFYDNKVDNFQIYGNLYNWYAVNDPRGLCPCGWQVASKDDFVELSSIFGGDSNCGYYLKDISNNYWIGDSTSCNSSGFKALPNGNRDETFSRIGFYAFFWHKESYLGDACSIDSLCAYECSLLSEFNYMNRDFGHKYRGMAVRCVKNKN